MGNKKDIGKFFENKLGAGKKAPATDLWKKINTSLDKEIRRRKKLFLLWIIGGSLSALLVVVFISGSLGSFNSNKPSEQILPAISNSENSSEKETSEKENSEVSKEQSQSADINQNVLSEIHKNTDSISKKTGKNSSTKNKSVDENFSVTKKYYYYNSSTDTQIITTNKAEIDSLVSENNRSTDTLKVKKSDNRPE